jgi:hypothetical protein
MYFWEVIPPKRSSNLTAAQQSLSPEDFLEVFGR